MVDQVTSERTDSDDAVDSVEPPEDVKQPEWPKLLQILGPGLITGASDDDPSGIATYSQAGAQFGFGLGWVLLLCWPLMCAIQEISARIGRVTGRGIAGVIRQHYPAPVLYILVFLLDAHNRVMSIATLQKQLAVSRLGDVELRPYFTQLCESLSSSMISDHDQLSIQVTIDRSAVHADISVSLGLIVTELVINALKHAFPGGRPGKITVDYQSRGANWTLSVGDNGVGMPIEETNATSGLGTNIVQALASQLRARVQISDTAPGTTVSIIHNQIIAVLDEAPV